VREKEDSQMLEVCSRTRIKDAGCRVVVIYGAFAKDARLVIKYSVEVNGLPV
jgi:hypothetical protein